MFLMTSRRAFLAGVVVSAFTGPLVVGAQPPGKVFRIGYLSTMASETARPPLSAFKRALLDLGYVEGRNLVIEYRWAEGRYERLPALARELVRLRADLILTPDGVPAALAAKAATKTIPVVFF